MQTRLGHAYVAHDNIVETKSRFGLIFRTKSTKSLIGHGKMTNCDCLMKCQFQDTVTYTVLQFH